MLHWPRHRQSRSELIIRSSSNTLFRLGVRPSSFLFCMSRSLIIRSSHKLFHLGCASSVSMASTPWKVSTNSVQIANSAAFRGVSQPRPKRRRLASPFWENPQTALVVPAEGAPRGALEWKEVSKDCENLVSEILNVPAVAEFPR
jgi:hypothetical protein